MKTRDCDVYRELIADYEWLDKRERALLDAHASGCDHCRHELDVVQGLGKVFREDALGRMPQNLTERILRSVGTESAGTATARGHLFSLGVAVAVLAAVATLTFPSEWFPLTTDWLGSLVAELSTADVFGGVVPAFRSGVSALGVPGLTAALAITFFLSLVAFLDFQRERNIR